MSQNLESKITKKVKEIDPDVCADVRVTDVEFHSQVDAITNLIESHTKDGVDTLTGSAIFLSMVEMMADALSEWELLKQNVRAGIKLEKDEQIENWNLDYLTHKLEYEVVPKKNESVITYKVAEDLCSKVQECHKMYDAVNTVVENLVSTHKNDASAVITKSPVFKGFLKLKSKYFADYKAAQNEVQTKCIPAEIIAKNPDWTLDYKTKVLTVYNV